MLTFKERQSLELDILAVPIPGATLALLRLLLKRPLRERVNAIDERTRHPGVFSNLRGDAFDTTPGDTHQGAHLLKEAHLHHRRTKHRRPLAYTITYTFRMDTLKIAFFNTSN